MTERDPDRTGLEFARDASAALYVNAWVRIMAAELGVPVQTDDHVAQMAGPIVAALNEGVAVGWAIAINDRAFAEESLERLRQQVEQGFAPAPEAPA